MDEIIEGCIKGKLDQSLCNRVLLRESIKAELDAINLYEGFAGVTNDEKIKSTLLDVAREEKTHVGEFHNLLLKNDAQFKEELKKGEVEVNEKKEGSD